ncbi:MAG: hypothetical protein QW304_08945 [Thermoproteota archaeon]
MGEEILGIFEGYMKGERRLLAWETVWCKLVFTTHRIIVVKEITSVFNIRLRSLGGGCPEYIITRASTRERLKMQAISTQLVENILKKNAENFEIPYADITVVEAIPNTEPDFINLPIYKGDLDVPKYDLYVKMNREYFDDFQKIIKTVLPDKS